MEVPLAFVLVAVQGVPLFSVIRNVGDDGDNTQVVPGTADDGADDDVDEDSGSNTDDEVGGSEDEDKDNNVEVLEEGADIDALTTECLCPLNSHLLIT